MTFHTALRQLKPSLITAHLLQQKGILVMWFNKYVHIQRSTYLMSLAAQGNSRRPTQIKNPNLHTCTHLWVKEKKMMLCVQPTKTICSNRNSSLTYTHTDTSMYKHHNNLFFKKQREQMSPMKGSKLRVGTCLHSLTTFWGCHQGGNQTARLL